MKYLCVKDEEGKLRPLAGLWKNDEYGKKSAEDYTKKEELEVVLVEIKEV